MVTMIIIGVFFAALFIIPFGVISKKAPRVHRCASERDDLEWFLFIQPSRQRKYLIDRYVKKGEMPGWTIAFKGFHSNMTCRGFQYVEGRTHKLSGEPIMCSKGFHACTLPRDCFGYYSDCSDVYHVVFLKNIAPRPIFDVEDSKICGGEIHIGVEIPRKYIQGTR